MPATAPGICRSPMAGEDPSRMKSGCRFGSFGPPGGGGLPAKLVRLYLVVSLLLGQREGEAAAWRHMLGVVGLWRAFL